MRGYKVYLPCIGAYTISKTTNPTSEVQVVSENDSEIVRKSLVFEKI